MHQQQIKKTLGIAAVYTEVSSYQQKGNSKQHGIQVDMLIDRADGIINVCEMKFYDAPFTITKKYAENLREKMQVLKQASPPKKSIFLTIISCFGIVENNYSSELVQNQVVLDELFVE